MKILIGSDYNGLDLKRHLVNFLKGEYSDAEVIDCGPTEYTEGDDYNDAAIKVAESVRSGGPDDRGILICGSGHGMTMQANRFKGIRAALAATPESAVMAREHDDANILCLSGSTTDPEAAEKIVTTFLDTKFPPLERRIHRIHRLDEGENYA